MTRSYAFLLLTCLGTAACSDHATEKAATPHAGPVEVVENAAAGWSADSAWRIEPEPFVSIGGAADGPPEYQLHRVFNATRQTDGTIVLANSGTYEIRFYDPTGKHIRTVGRSGNGPGEYRSLILLRRFRGDSLIVWDGLAGRGTVLDPGGAYVRTVRRPKISGEFVYFPDVFRDGSLLGVAPGFRGGRHLEGGGVAEEDVVHAVAWRPQEKRRMLVDTALVFRLRPDGRIDSIGAFFSSEQYQVDRTTFDMPFAHRAALVAQNDLVHYGSGHSFEMRTYAGNGQLRRITRVARPNPELTSDMVDAFIAKRLERVTDPATRRSNEARFRAVEYHRTLPAFSDLRVDRDGFLWAAAFHEWFQPQPLWTVFAEDGRLLGDVTPPPGLFVYEIGSDYVLGRTVDEFGIEKVGVYRLRRTY